ncbi:MAG TPA: NrfD/PsrC family molybdoenzyme membrane anchor subunit [Candidatus Acidoferrales bacterium]|nr:NrfD/PsrC family molybdoenzyme membrane anchor subunit [Candidatus Acidoferrales bacterium]
MRYGFVIDHNRCIGCHACTVACKEEHNVPLGVYRTWVKYIEKGEFPDTKRYFGVLRCNHCDHAPCIEICPTAALFRRQDGIVDFDSERCIGCKSCMQACPYDALYIDPGSQTAAKCNFCAHRVEAGLEPACVIVCPEQAIVAGDLDDRAGKIAAIVAQEKVRVRKPEKGTAPKLFYVGIDADLLQPARVAAQPAFLWAEKKPAQGLRARPSGSPAPAPAGAAREVYDVAHPAPWGAKIAAYLWTKSIAAGALLVAAVALALGFEDAKGLLHAVAPAVALLFTAVTSLLLIFDLKRPERFYYLLTKPNLKSWLVLGGYLLVLYGAVASGWLLGALMYGFVPPAVIGSAGVLAAAVACYTAFLFRQAKGRDLWLSPLLFWHLLFQAAAAGAAVLLLCALGLGAGPFVTAALGKALAFALAGNLSLILLEVYVAPHTEEGKQALDLLTRGPWKKAFWIGAVGMGAALPLALLIGSGFAGEGIPAYLAPPVLALAGLWIFEHLWVRAGQAVPLS